MDYRLTDDMGGGAYPFGNRLFAGASAAIAEAQDIANRNGAPCQVWRRDGWFTTCEVPDDCLDPTPQAQGWEDWALVDPQSDDGVSQ